MKRLLLMFSLLTVGFYGQSQVVFNVEEPASIEGGYDLTYANDLTDWSSMVDLDDPENAIVSYIELVDDGTADDSLGCSSLNNDFGGLVDTLSILDAGTGYTNAQGLATDNISGSGSGLIVDIVVDNGEVDEIHIVNPGQGYELEDTIEILGATGSDAQFRVEDLTGKIAVVYRGECQFGTKALNAQNAGAIGVIIIQNEPGGPTGMLAGDDGDQVEIPTTMISDIDGAAIMEEYNAGEDVRIFIGNKLGRYENDLVLRNGFILMPKEYARPSLITQDGSEQTFEVGAFVYNEGSEEQTDVVLNATVTDPSGAVIYDESASGGNLDSGDSVFIALPDYEAPTVDEGFYEFTYMVSADEDEDYDFDNVIDLGFAITDGVFGYVPLDETDLSPIAQGGSRILNTDGNLSDRFSSCVHFRDPNASRMIATGMTFAAFVANDAANPSIEGELIDVIAYRLNDQFDDIDSPGFNGNPVDLAMIEPSFAEYIYTDDSQSEFIHVNFSEAVELEDNARYFFCVGRFNSDVAFNHNFDIDYNLNFNNYLQPLFPAENDNNWNTIGFGSDPAPGHLVHFVDAAQLNVQKEKLAIDMNVYPSPASDYVTVDFKGNEVNGIEVRNMTGQLVLSETVKIGEDSRQLDVQGLDNGIYLVNVKLSNGLTKTMNVVVNR